jgi:type VI secretion system protein ImpC
MKDDGVRIRLSAEPSSERLEEREPGERRFRILLLGDFGLRGCGAGAPPLQGAELRPVEVHAGNYEEILGRWTPPLKLPGRAAWRAESMDDFHPDSLAELPGDATVEPVEEPEAGAAAEGPEPGGGLSFLEQMLGERLPAAAPPQADSGREVGADIDEAIRKIAREHATPAPSAREVAAGSRARQATAERIRRILEYAPFRQAEVNWRSVYFLLRRLEPGGEVQLFLADVSPEEWAADLGGKTDLRETAFYHAVVRDAAETFGETPWAVVASLFDLEPEPSALIALSRAGRIAAAGGTCLIASAERQWFEFAMAAGEDRLQKAWRVLRAAEEAGRIGLVYPRFLLRAGYGPGGLSAGVFEEEEIPSPGLWASAALACVVSLGTAFRDFGWAMHAGARLELAGLPAGLTQAPLEATLTESEAEAALDQGVMPLVWWKGTDRIRLLRIQSIGDPPGALLGSWG